MGIHSELLERHRRVLRGLAAGVWRAELSFIEASNDLPYDSYDINVNLTTVRPMEYGERLSLTGLSNPGVGTLDTSGGDYLLEVSGAWTDVRWELELVYLTA